VGFGTAVSLLHYSFVAVPNWYLHRYLLVALGYKESFGIEINTGAVCSAEHSLAKYGDKLPNKVDVNVWRFDLNHVKTLDTDFLWINGFGFTDHVPTNLGNDHSNGKDCMLDKVWRSAYSLSVYAIAVVVREGCNIGRVPSHYALYGRTDVNPFKPVAKLNLELERGKT
jgi:hypothetical protein